MLSDILWVFILSCLLIVGLTRPYIALCAAIFVDVLKPQDLSSAFLANQPLSFLAAAVFFLSIAFNIKDISLPRKFVPSMLLIIFIIWVIITTMGAQFPEPAWLKFDYAYKTILLALFIPFVINTRVKLDLFIMTIVSSMAYYAIIGGAKTLLGTTGYGIALIPTRAGNSGITESSSLAMEAIFTIPLIYYLYKHSPLVKSNKFMKPLFIALAFACMLTTIGTYARTGFVAIAVLAFFLLLKSNHRVLAISVVLIATVLAGLYLSDAWIHRMKTITSPDQEESAYGRIVVWKWTLDYVKDRPLMGGGFEAYRANALVLNDYVGSYSKVNYNKPNGKAFHNIIFEVLGEHGYVGLTIFLLIIFLTWRLNTKNAQNKQYQNWGTNLAIVNNIALFIYLACGQFIAVAFTPWLYYFSSISVCLYTIQDKMLAIPEQQSQ